MPVFNLCCKNAHESRILAKTLPKTSYVCPQCGEPLERVPTGAASQVVERLDNGLMRRAIERPKDAERLTQERKKKHQHENEEAPPDWYEL